MAVGSAGDRQVCLKSLGGESACGFAAFAGASPGAGSVVWFGAARSAGLPSAGGGGIGWSVYYGRTGLGRSAEHSFGGRFARPSAVPEPATGRHPPGQC